MRRDAEIFVFSARIKLAAHHHHHDLLMQLYFTFFHVLNIFIYAGRKHVCSFDVLLLNSQQLIQFHNIIIRKSSSLLFLASIYNLLLIFLFFHLQFYFIHFLIALSLLKKYDCIKFAKV